MRMPEHANLLVRAIIPVRVPQGTAGMMLQICVLVRHRSAPLTHVSLLYMRLLAPVHLLVSVISPAHVRRTISGMTARIHVRVRVVLTHASLPYMRLLEPAR